MSAFRVQDQADFDLDRFIDMFDQALTSDDPRVVDALRGLMMMVILTTSEDHGPAVDRARGPLRRIVEEQRSLTRRVNNIEDSLQRIHRDVTNREYGTYDVDKYMANVVQSAEQQKAAQNVVMKLNGGKL